MNEHVAQFRFARAVASAASPSPSPSPPALALATNPGPASPPRLPHHRLVAFAVARDLVLAVRAAGIRDVHLRDQALRAAKSCALNCAEGAARVTRPDKARAFAIARGEASEAAAAVEIAAACGDASPANADAVARLADRVIALLTPLAR